MVTTGASGAGRPAGRGPRPRGVATATSMAFGCGRTRGLLRMLRPLVATDGASTIARLTESHHPVRTRLPDYSRPTEPPMRRRTNTERPCTRRPQRRPLVVEEREAREVLTAAITGQVFQELAAINPPTNPPQPGIPGVIVFLDANGNRTLDFGEGLTQTDAQGNYTFTDLAPGNYNVAVSLPRGMWGSSAQGLDYRLALADGTTFANLNFALLFRTDAVVRNLYERVLVRPAEQAGFSFWTANLNTFTLSPGQVLDGFLNSPEYGTVVAPLANMVGAFAKGQPVDRSVLAQQAYQLRNAV